MEIQKILLFGVTTRMGRNILNEALNRGHKVEVGETNGNRVIHSYVKGHDVIISTYQVGEEPQEHLNSTLLLIDAAKLTGVKRLIIVGYPGNNEVKSMDMSLDNIKLWKSIAEIQEEVFNALQDEKDIYWSYIYQPENPDTIERNSTPFISDKMVIRSSEGERWINADDCVESVLNEADAKHLQEEEPIR